MNTREEQIAFHKGAFQALARQREERARSLHLTEQMIETHKRALKKLGAITDHKTSAELNPLNPMPRTVESEEAALPGDDREQVYCVEIKTSYRCNQDCIMCPYHERRHTPPMRLEEVIENLHYLMEHFRFERFELSGGEPTIYPYFFDILDWLGKNLPEVAVRVQTNGTRLADAEFAKRLSGYPLEFFVSFHAPSEEVNRLITNRKGHFMKAAAGIDNLLRLRKPVMVDVVITRLNEGLLNEINMVLCGLGVTNIEYRLVHLTGRVPHGEFMPDIKGVVERIESSFRFLRYKNTKVNISNMPYCFFKRDRLCPPERDVKFVFIDREHQKDNHTVGTTLETAISDRFDENRIKADTCQRCCFEYACPGIDCLYYEEVKDDGRFLRPIE